MLETVRELKSIGVDVYFEKENIHSISGDGELMLSILTCFAQEESRSVSENCKWRIRKGFEEGRPHNNRMLGYLYQNGEFIIEPEEAEVVRTIFTDYLSGMGKNAIMKKLNAAGFCTTSGNEWRENNIYKILRKDSIFLRTYFYPSELSVQTTDKTPVYLDFLLSCTA